MSYTQAPPGPAQIALFLGNTAPGRLITTSAGPDAKKAQFPTVLDLADNNPTTSARPPSWLTFCLLFRRLESRRFLLTSKNSSSFMQTLAFFIRRKYSLIILTIAAYAALC